MFKVMIVDDEPWVLEGLRTMIDWGKYGFEICGEALNGTEALQIIQECCPHLVLTDINMPVINGLELIGKVNQLMNPPPRFVILSGYDDFKYAQVALRHRVNDYLLKPIDEEEIEALLERLSGIIRNEIVSKETQDKKQFLIVNNIINRFIQGEYNENLEGMAQNALKYQPNAELMVILMEPDSLGIQHSQELNAYFPADAFTFFQDGTGRVGILLQSEGISDELLQVATAQIHRELLKRMEGQTIVAVSGRMNGIKSIREIYLQALEVWKLKYHQEKNGVFWYNDLSQVNRAQEAQEERFKPLLDKIQANDTEQIQIINREVFASFAECLVPVESVQAQIAHLELSICRIIAQMDGNPDLIMKKMQGEYGSLGELGDYFMLSNYVNRLCLMSASYLADLRQQNEGNTIFNVIQYVDREFRNKLQLQDLARQFHMNSTYLGQLFRKQTGRSFSEYLNEKRIEEAKSLLKRTQLKISDIAQQVGFSNVDYFIDKFKAKVGVVPSVYKNEK